jgi:hypothetical protein
MSNQNAYGIRTESSIGAGTVGMTTTKAESQWLARVMRIVSHVAFRESDGWAGQRAACDGSSTSQQLADTRNEADGASTATRDMAVDLNGSCHEAPALNADIKIYDPEKLANVASSSAAQMRRPIIIVGALSLTLGIAWFGGWNSHQFVGAVPSSVPVDHKAASLSRDQPISTVTPSAVDTPQQAIPGTATNGKINVLTANESGGRDSTQNAVGDARTAAIPPQKSAQLSPSGAVHRRPKTPFPETKPTTIDGWVVREVANGTAVLQGPNGVWKVARGDSVPGLGTIDSIVLWGSRWIVATSRGLITTP